MGFARGITEMSASKCECSMAIAVLGDGCRYCQPQEYINQLEEWLDEERARVAELESALQKLLSCISETRGACSYNAEKEARALLEKEQES
jgi:hypothetical protein